MAENALVESSHASLINSVADAKRELFNLRFQLATGQLENTSRMKLVKKEVARLKTELRAREIATAETLAVEAPDTAEALAAEAPDTAEAPAVEAPDTAETLAAEAPDTAEALAVEAPDTAEALAAEAPDTAEALAAEAPDTAEVSQGDS